ncbi:MAG: beta-galactosidase [Planctomycetia bacterium]|nr:beta-galactosidase [Planctomycetia bacterium]
MSTWDGKILVPFPVESSLSGVMKPVGPDKRLWYRRAYNYEKQTSPGRVLLNFGAVDWEATVFVNGKEVGTHRGGYDAFAFDVTDALKADGRQEIVVAVFDPSDAGFQPRGKQVQNPHSIWYTSVTGIWQTVFLERVPHVYIRRLKLVPDVDNSAVRITVELNEPQDERPLQVAVSAGGKDVAYGDGQANKEFSVKIPNAHLWSPDDPFLYDLEVSVAGSESVQSYFGLRKIEVKKDEEGVNRLFLNNKPLFQFGPLDQGWWPDGLYTAPSDDALKFDVEMTKKLGFNMCRKHVKVEPSRWYYWCDKLGLLVWQDMPSGDRYIGASDPDITRSGESAQNFDRELRAMIDGLHNHPSIVMWVPFNEGWGQFDTARVASLVKRHDPTRLVNSASGWTDRGAGDVMDIHSYPGPSMPKLEDKRAAVLGEFGGLGLPVKGHTWQDEKNWGYRSFASREDLTDAYLDLLFKLRPLVARGLSAAVYTQTTDVEIEVNGLLTYDREVVKMGADAIAAAARKLHLPPPEIEQVVASSQKEPQEWRYTTEKPASAGSRRPLTTASGKPARAASAARARPARPSAPPGRPTTSGSAARSSLLTCPSRPAFGSITTKTQRCTSTGSL